jgi:hypothetical protein
MGVGREGHGHNSDGSDLEKSETLVFLELFIFP